MLARLPSPRPRGVRWHVTGSSHGPGVPGDTQRLSLSQPVGGPVSVLRPDGQGTVSFWTSRRAGILWAHWCLYARHAHIWYVLLPEAGSLTGVFPRGCGCEQSPIAGSLTLQDLSSPCPHPRHPCILSRRPGHASCPHTPSVAELSARPAGWDCQAAGPPAYSCPGEVTQPFHTTPEHTLLVVGPAAGGRECVPERSCGRLCP